MSPGGGAEPPSPATASQGAETQPPEVLAPKSGGFGARWATLVPQHGFEQLLPTSLSPCMGFSSPRELRAGLNPTPWGRGALELGGFFHRDSQSPLHRSRPRERGMNGAIQPDGRELKAADKSPGAAGKNLLPPPGFGEGGGGGGGEGKRWRPGVPNARDARLCPCQEPAASRFLPAATGAKLPSRCCPVSPTRWHGRGRWLEIRSARSAASKRLFFFF